jgi:hypothetical protein
MRGKSSILALAIALTTAGASAQEAEEVEQEKLEPERQESWTVPTLHGLGLMTGMRLSEAVIWPEPFAETDLSEWGESYELAFTKPPKWDSSESFFEWDGDEWYINGVGHALFGSELYLRARTCQKSVVAALLFTTAGSVLWEYGFEANRVRPSALDLGYTPLAGLVLGEARYVLWTAAAELDDPGFRGVLKAVLDPFGELERALGTPC